MPVLRSIHVVRPIAISLLGLAFVCNVAVLFLPFMQVRIAFGSEPYSLFRSVRMFWESGLYVLAILVVVFSIVFPFAKLWVLAWVVRARELDARQRLCLEWVERLGKWSMLDVFLVCLILTLTSGQIMVDAVPLIGIPVFTVAIVLSMLTGELLSATFKPEGARLHAPDPEAARRTTVWIALAGLALLGAIALPFLRIRDWKLADNAYSLFTLPGVLWHEGSIASTCIAIAFLIVAPIAAWCAAVAWWWCAREGAHAMRWRTRMEVLRRWSMLDVFGLALAIFLVEGDYLMRTEVRWGALFLVAVVVIKHVADAAIRATAVRSR